MGIGNNSYIISLKYSPGLWKEFTLMGERLRTHDVSVRYLISKKYANIGPAHSGTQYVTSSDRVATILKDVILFNSLKKNILSIFSQSPPKYTCFYNPHPLNPILCYLIKKYYPDSIISLYLHDPFKPDKSHYGMVKSFYIRIVDLVQSKTVKCCDYIISPSDYSAKLFNQRYPKFKGINIVAPLLVPDGEHQNRNKRIYFSIVGTAHQATGHDTFVRLINYVAEKDFPFKFAIISSSNIDSFLNVISEKGKRLLTVINKSIITDQEINNIISQSLAVFRFDKEVTQSGVVPVCYMNATPVIARDIPGLRQHVEHKGNGYLVPYACTPSEIIEAMAFVSANISVLKTNARRSYETIWASDNFDKYYDWLIQSLNR
ncbi:MAG TPA: glycosyltransferase [Smithella sp.]|nr:glycosyltransferase [Smithella sp.]